MWVPETFVESSGWNFIVFLYMTLNLQGTTSDFNSQLAIQATGPCVIPPEEGFKLSSYKNHQGKMYRHVPKLSISDTFVSVSKQPTY